MLHRDFPQLRLLLREQMTPQILQNLANGQLDAALLALPLPDDGLDCAPLFDEPFMAAFPVQHRLAKTRPRAFVRSQKQG